MKNHRFGCLLLACALAGTLAHADSFLMSTGTSLAFPSLGAVNDPVNGQNGSLAFWANKSVDGLTNPNDPNSPPLPYSQLNVGNFLTGTCGPSAATVGSCPAGAFDGMTTPNLDPNSITYLGNGLNPVSSFYFVRDGSTTDYGINPALVFTANLVQFGWYDAGDPNSLNPIFSGLTQDEALPEDWSLTNIPFGTSYGLYVTVNYGNGYLATYYTESQFNTFTPDPGFSQLLGSDTVDGANKQHFALFQSGQNDYLALEDGIGNLGFEGLGDYQDGVFVIGAMPEPSTLILGAFAIGAGFMARRRFAKPA